MKSKIFLGTLKHTAKLASDFLPYNEGSTRNRLYLEKHRWDCGWYWGFGYIGNAAIHTHFDSTFLGKCDTSINNLFINPRFTQNEWWQLRDMFIQAKALQKAAKIYIHGGHQTNNAYRNVNAEKAKSLNDDLELVLNEIWKLCQVVSSR